MEIDYKTINDVSNNLSVKITECSTLLNDLDLKINQLKIKLWEKKLVGEENRLKLDVNYCEELHHALLAAAYHLKSLSETMVYSHNFLISKLEHGKSEE